MTCVARVLVVDDDPRLVKVVANLLRKHEFQVESVPNGELGRQALRRGDIDLALLDVNLPDVNGLSLIFQLREEGNTTPIILLTVRTEVHEQALGLRPAATTTSSNRSIPRCCSPGSTPCCGAVPPAPRAGPRPPQRAPGDPAGHDRPHRPAGVQGRHAGAARPLEYAVLEFLAVNRGRAVSKEELMLSVWGTSRGVSRTLAEHISRLRRKLGDDLIMTQTGYGYLIPAPPGDRATTTQ